LFFICYLRDPFCTLQGTEQDALHDICNDKVCYYLRFIPLLFRHNLFIWNYIK